jgi:hypothetical protein
MKVFRNYLLRATKPNCSGYRTDANSDNWTNARRETSRHFKNEKREYLEDKIKELE